MLRPTIYIPSGARRSPLDDSSLSRRSMNRRCGSWLVSARPSGTTRAPPRSTPIAGRALLGPSGPGIGGQVTAGKDPIDEPEPGLGPSRMATAAARFSSTTGDGRPAAARRTIPRSRPSRFGRARRLGVHRRDGRLQRIGAELARPERSLHQRDTLRDHLPVPARPVLIVQQHQLSIGRACAPRAGFVQQHQGQQPERFRLRQQLDQQSAQPDRLGGEVVPGEGLARGGRVALVEDQVDDVEHGRQALGQLRAGGTW